MSSNEIALPNEIIHLILLFCQTAKDYLSQSLINRQWSHEAHRLKSLMKTRFSRKITTPGNRFIMWDFDIRVTVVGYGEYLQRHGLEECVQTYHRVGGPGASVYYLERHWQDGKLHGLEIVREINEIWYSRFGLNQDQMSNNPINHPYDSLSAIDSMRKYGRHCIVPQNRILPEGCDYLGKILFKHEWITETLEDSKHTKRSIIDELDLLDVDSLYDFIDNIDLYQISRQTSSS